MYVTPVQAHGDYLLKREDLYGLPHARGGKVRAAAHMLAAMPDAAGITTAAIGSAPQVTLAAELAAAHGLPCRIWMPARKDYTPEMTAAEAMGATLVQMPPIAWFNAVNARARDYAQEHGWLHLPFWMDTEAMVWQTAAQAEALPALSGPLVVPVGSGMTLAGVLWGLRAAGAWTRVVGVLVGADPTRRLDKYAPAGWAEQCTLVPMVAAPRADVCGVPLDPGYEGLAAHLLRPGRCLWVTGHRDGAGAGLPLLIPAAQK